MKIFLKSIAVFLLIQSCKVTEEFLPHPMDHEVETFPGASQSLDTISMANMTLAEVFRDTQLLQLLELGLQNNYDLQSAFQSIEIANAYYLQGKAAFLPNVDVSLQPNFIKNSKNSQFGSFLRSNQIIQSYQLGVSAAWEADLWGKLKSREKSALATLFANQAMLKLGQTELITHIASLYYQLLALDAQIEIIEKTIQNRRKSIQTIEDLKTAGLVTEVAVQQTKAQLYQSQALLVDFEQSRQLIENTMNVLLSRPHQPVERGKWTELLLPEYVQIGVPAQLLENRPDLKMTEYQIRAKYELINEAKTYFYPALRISASTGFESLDIGKLLNPGSIFGSLAGGIVQPLANQRMNKTRLEVAQLEYQQVVNDYESQYLNAIKEVSDALIAAKAAEEKQGFQLQQLEALEKATEFSEDLLTYGLSNYLEVLRAQDQALSVELNIVGTELSKWNAVVSLYKALGGGWQKD